MNEHYDCGEERIIYKEGTLNIISKVAYLIGVPKHIFEHEYNPPKIEIFEELEKNKNARIMRNLCALRTAIERNFYTISKEILYNLKNLNTLPNLIPQECIKELSDDGIQIIKANTKPDDYIISINKLIAEHINSCKEIFPFWIRWDYVSDIFLMPNGTKKEAIVKEAKVYYESKNLFPYQVYMHFDPNFLDGNIFASDKKFVKLLYKSHGDDFEDLSKVTDAGYATKEGVHKFLEESEKICMMVDCENSDPFRLHAVLKGLRQKTLLEKIDKIILYDDIHTSSAWGILGDFTELAVEHVTIDRVKGNKSLVDMTLATGTCREFYANNTKSFIIVSSDSDYWGLIRSLPDARFFVMAEKEKCGQDIIKALSDQGIPYCYLNDFYTGNTDEIKIAAVLAAVNARIEREVTLNLHRLLETGFFETRVDFSEQEKTKLYEKIAKNIQVNVSTEGDIGIAVTA